MNHVKFVAIHQCNYVSTMFIRIQYPDKLMIIYATDDSQLMLARYRKVYVNIYIPLQSSNVVLLLPSEMCCLLPLV